MKRSDEDLCLRNGVVILVKGLDGDAVSVLCEYQTEVVGEFLLSGARWEACSDSFDLMIQSLELSRGFDEVSGEFNEWVDAVCQAERGVEASS